MVVGSVIHLLRDCASTNDVARDLARRGAREGTAVIADEQTAGRGTKGRGWHSPPGQGLYVSVILRPPASDVSLLPLVAGIAVAEAILSSTSLEVRLKWPNDIVWNGKKVGGILCESEFTGAEINCAILGIGLNIGQRRKDFPEEMRATAASLRMALRRSVERESLARSLFRALDSWYREFVSGARARILRAFESKLIFPVGKVITVRADRESETGIFLGFDAGARLILEKSGKKSYFSPAEILEIGYNIQESGAGREAPRKENPACS
ncbi:MAG: biotin--[acetyl-CoA-carboxylase] ligase [Candidatus Aminicenantes bacterium]|nr:biotin--[acetyl-CoA-carboxylase] ligase [Candidatus Aminicenantes bacterium]